MKQVLTTLVVLLVVMGGYLWLNGRLTKNGQTPVKETKNEEVFLVAKGAIKEGEEGELELWAKDETKVIRGFDVGLNYEAAAIKILEVSVNNTIFDRGPWSTNDEDLGKVEIKGESGKSSSELNKGEVLLAKIKIKAVKKGAAMFYRDRAAMMKVEETGKVSEISFEMPDFKLNVL